MNETQKTTSGQIGPPPLPPAAFVQPRYKGVGGWLLLFCLGLTVLNPLITLGLLAGSYIESSEYYDRSPDLLVITVIDTLLSLGVMGFGMYAGFGLLRIRPGAVRTAKRYLLCFLAYYAIGAVLSFMAGLPSADNVEMIFQTAKSTGRAVACFAIWYAYLGTSERVKATYES